MKDYYFVIGGESTGTKLVTRLLMEVGCFGDDGDVQRLDGLMSNIKAETELPLVWRRSFPHNKDWTNLVRWVHTLDVSDSNCLFLVVVRNWVCASMSAVNRGHSRTAEEAVKKLRKAYLLIFQGLKVINRPYLIVSYDELIRSPYFYLSAFYDELGFKISYPELSCIGETIIKQENFKHYLKRSQG